MLINNQYRVGRKLGSGNFGEIRIGKDEISNRLVAVKIEISPKENPQLSQENRFYHMIHKNGLQVGIPEVYYFGAYIRSNVLVMELLGASLEELFDRCGRKFSVRTVMEIAVQTIMRLKTLHSHNIIHRDIKPENFLVGRVQTPNCDMIYVVDFGLSKEFIDPVSKRHIPYREHKNLTGTARYMSINTHLGKEQSRRDDLEALCHMCVYFLRGSLPWQGLKADTLRERYNKICEVKRNTSIEVLCSGLPDEFVTFLRYSRQLPFEDPPDYNYLVSLFEEHTHRKENPEGVIPFDWKPLLEERALHTDYGGKMSATSEAHNLMSGAETLLTPYGKRDSKLANKIGSTTALRSNPKSNQADRNREQTECFPSYGENPSSGKRKKRNCDIL